MKHIYTYIPVTYDQKYSDEILKEDKNRNYHFIILVFNLVDSVQCIIMETTKKFQHPNSYTF